MQKLIDTNTVPPGGWQWEVPETKWLAKGESFKELVEVVRRHYGANGFSYGTATEARVEDGLCSALCERRDYKYVRHPELPVSEFIEPLLKPAGVKVKPPTALKIKKLLST